MWIKRYAKEFPGLKREDAWRGWTDVNNWTKWHGHLDKCEIKGDFAVGNSFILKPAGKPEVRISLLAINEGHSFTDCTYFPGAKMYDTHELIETANGLKMVNTIKVTGALKWLWIFLVAGKVAKSIPGKMDSLVHYLDSEKTKSQVI